MTDDPIFVEPDEYESNKDQYELVGANYGFDGTLGGYYVRPTDQA